MKHLARVRPINITGAERWTGSVDYFSATTSWRMEIPAMEAVAEQLCVMSVIAGGVRVKAGSQGYRGWRCGSLFFGVREDGAWLEVRGGLADIAFSRAFGQGWNVSRLDVAVTAWFDTDPSELVMKVRDQADVNHKAADKKWTARPRLVDGMGEGNTFYVGSAASDKMIRVYDKQRQTGDAEYEKAIRFEVQFRRDKAKAGAARLWAANNHVSACAALVAAELQAWRVPYPYVVNVSMSPVLVSYTAPDLDTKMRWFEEQVAAAVTKMGYVEKMHPTMRRLIDTIERVGYTKSE